MQNYSQSKRTLGRVKQSAEHEPEFKSIVKREAQQVAVAVLPHSEDHFNALCNK